MSDIKTGDVVIATLPDGFIFPRLYVVKKNASTTVCCYISKSKELVTVELLTKWLELPEPPNNDILPEARFSSF